MRFATRLLVFPLLTAYPQRAVLIAPAQPNHASTRAAADSTTVSVRWNRLVPGFADEAAASRRAARAAAAAAKASLGCSGRLVLGVSERHAQSRAMSHPLAYGRGNSEDHRCDWWRRER